MIVTNINDTNDRILFSCPFSKLAKNGTTYFDIARTDDFHFKLNTLPHPLLKSIEQVSNSLDFV